MRNLLEFLQRYHHWFLFVLFEALSMVLLFQFNHYQGSVWFTTANALVGSVYEMNAAMESFFTQAQNNEQLTARNFYQERQLAQLRRLYKEATQQPVPKEVEELEKLGQYKLIPANGCHLSLQRSLYGCYSRLEQYVVAHQLYNP